MQLASGFGVHLLFAAPKIAKLAGTQPPLHRPRAINAIDISIVVPVFNEAENLVDLCQEARKVLIQLGATWEMIFINDGSTDGSHEILDHLAEEDQRVRIIHFKRNFGQTAAMMAGFDYARGEVIIPPGRRWSKRSGRHPQNARALE
jgi:cellulose synthase/poly-beta-1,6-N-acetylglucosamine synthase-like glycosyltransferase